MEEEPSGQYDQARIDVCDENDQRSGERAQGEEVRQRLGAVTDGAHGEQRDQLVSLQAHRVLAQEECEGEHPDRSEKESERQGLLSAEPGPVSQLGEDGERAESGCRCQDHRGARQLPAGH